MCLCWLVSLDVHTKWIIVSKKVVDSPYRTTTIAVTAGKLIINFQTNHHDH